MNYVCDLPRTFRNTNYSNYFRDPIIGLLLAKELLERAEKEYTDLDIHKEINFRLSKIEHYLDVISQKNKFRLFY